jgi:hypothetical protein|tara:strand:+ start:939 stop:1160 length:222 start_codon:yes stop_codon:yes gene_type:complete
MRNIGRPRLWTDEDIERIERLIKTSTAREAGRMVNKSKNSVLGILYREKLKKGYVPPLDSKYARIRKYKKGFG